ncbi:hypothetical protein [Achromobacter xylosoxidans]|uniref:hypothetical protein n=1 Tax=Alcaligenes xylosoxydans xylosoxydans TaxID=85698 RepID=UPI0013AF40B7|nr:hypothetical protein [Achromobacter xylosoxidans]
MDSTILAAIVAGASALLGVALTAYAQSRSQVIERNTRLALDRERRRSEWLDADRAEALARLERAHRLVSIIDRECSATILNIQWSAGTTAAEYNQRYLALCAEVDELRSIADLYEPDLMNDVDAIYGQMNMFWGSHKNILELTGQGKKVDHNSECLARAHQASDKVGVQARQIKSQLRRLAARHNLAQG